MGGHSIGAGELIIPLIASANRDEEVFDEPERFKIDRSPNRTWGSGLVFTSAWALILRD